jgi:hypothetical protein
MYKCLSLNAKKVTVLNTFIVCLGSLLTIQTFLFIQFLMKKTKKELKAIGRVKGIEQ